jgi:hypothetical protein
VSWQWPLAMNLCFWFLVLQIEKRRLYLQQTLSQTLLILHTLSYSPTSNVLTFLHLLVSTAEVTLNINESSTVLKSISWKLFEKNSVSYTHGRRFTCFQALFKFSGVLGESEREPTSHCYTFTFPGQFSRNLKVFMCLAQIVAPHCLFNRIVLLGNGHFPANFKDPNH